MCRDAAILITLDDLDKALAAGEVESLNLIIKGDVSGSVEALEDAAHEPVRAAVHDRHAVRALVPLDPGELLHHVKKTLEDKRLRQELS